MKRHGLAQFVSKENKIYNYKIHLLSFLNAKQTNDGICLNKTGEYFNLANISGNVRVRL